MKAHARVVVIGGGVVGCSVLYHLTKAGWKDVVLVEREQLTAGSTWHAAGGFHTLNGDPNVAKLQGYTIGLYDELEKISGISCGLHRSGGLLLADTPARMEWLKMAHGRARYLGLDTELISPKEAKQLLPLIEEQLLRRRHGRSRRRQPRSFRHHPCLRQVGGHRWRRDLPADAGDGDQPSRRRQLGRSHARRARSTPSTWSMPADSGRARSAAWSASSCRCWRWSTCTW